MNHFQQDLCIVLTTINSKELAYFIAKELVSMSIAACVQVDEIKSIYQWNGNIENEKEFRLSIKTSALLYKDVSEFIKKNHSYEIPEIMKIKVDEASEEYAKWAFSVLK